MNFTSEHIGFGHGEAHPFSRQQRRASRRITNQCCAPIAPRWNLDLADPVEIDVFRGVERVQDLWRFPLALAKDVMQRGFRPA
jgi:hypothetical protein